MSHYSVLIATKEEPTSEIINAILDPYDENKEVPPYIASTKEELIKNFIQDTMTRMNEYEKNPESISQDYYNEVLSKAIQYTTANDREAIYKMATRFYEPNEFDAEGNLISTYNPNSKWDWWVVGGRFDGAFPHNVMKASDLKSIEFSEINNLEEKYPQEYAYYQRLITGKEDSFYRLEYLQERYPTFEAYLYSTKNPVSYAFIDLEGNWHEPGKMLMFGCSTSTPQESSNWDKDFYKKFIEPLPENTWITLIDCHI